MRNTGVLAPATMMRVLHAEHVDAATVVDCVPALGIPIVEAMRLLHDEWRLDRLGAGQALGATVDELRIVGWSAESIDDEVGVLPTDARSPHARGPLLTAALDLGPACPAAGM
jgi:hypothetical protein